MASFLHHPNCACAKFSPVPYLELLYKQRREISLKVNFLAYLLFLKVWAHIARKLKVLSFHSYFLFWSMRMGKFFLFCLKNAHVSYYSLRCNCCKKISGSDGFSLFFAFFHHNHFFGHILQESSKSKFSMGVFLIKFEWCDHFSFFVWK